MLDPRRNIGDWLELTPGLSPFDRSLIRLLQVDGRRSLAYLAQELGVAKKTVRRRLSELEASGVVKITTVGDPYLMGYRVIANVGVRVDCSRDVREVAEELAAGRRAFYVAIVTGRYNVMVEISCIDNADLLETVERDIARVRGVLDYEIHPYMRLFYQDPSFEASREKQDVDPALHPERVSFDWVDRDIIARLNENGRVPYQTIARGLQISDSQVRQRVRRMIDAGALRVMAMTSPMALGFETVTLIGIATYAGVSVEAIAARLAQLPAVIYVVITGGRFRLHVEVACTDGEDLLDLIETQVGRVEGISALEPWTYLRLYYRSVRPIEPEDEFERSASADGGTTPDQPELMAGA
ncbi:MAG TPA: AsnC family transcriptional regulator [Solirubrobacteraceae bacterium]|nr:AsnC family transcriptional regulator [Solirubrobacteraceae bacterium]